MSIRVGFRGQVARELMEMEMDSTLSLYHPPSPSPSPGQDAAFPYYYYYPPNSVAADGFHIPAAAAAAPHGTVIMLEPDNPAAPASRRRSRSRSRVRMARKDERHSKIYTAGGMRDRRMRLSMDVARRFFALQDKLGFDKASKTVQWLLDMSKAGINDLATTTSMSEDGSVLLQDYNDLQTMADSSDRNKQQIGSNLKRKNINESSTTKESRARARERARERTRERNCLRWSSVPAVVNQAEAPPPPAAAAAPCSYNVEEQQQDQPWELSGVVFAKAHRFHSTHG